MKDWIKVFMPLIVVILTIIIGNMCVIQPFQEKQWKEQYATELKNEERKEAIKFFEQISDLMDKRLHLTRQYLQSIKNHNKITEQKRKEKNLGNIVYKWNLQINKNIVKTSLYLSTKGYIFNPKKCAEKCGKNNTELCECKDKQIANCLKEKRGEFECGIHLNVRCIHQKLHKKTNTTESLEKIGLQIDCLNQRIVQFDNHALNFIFQNKNDSK